MEFLLVLTTYFAEFPRLEITPRIGRLLFSVNSVSGW